MVAQVKQPNLARVAIVGGGISGLACAQELQQNGYAVTVYDKGRAPGGRVSTRRRQSHQFDHGAQYFTVRDPVFERHVESWKHDRVVAEWTPRLIRINPDGAREAAKSSKRYVGIPTMSAIARHLARDLHVRRQTSVANLERQGDGWLVRDETGDTAPFDALIVAMPPTQAAPLLADAPCVQSIAKSVGMSSCWTLMIQLENEVDPGFDAAFVEGSAMSWVARDGSKPGRGDTPTWVVHASPQWSSRHDYDDRAVVSEILESKLSNILGVRDLDVVDQQIHFWRFAAPLTTHPDRCVFNPDLRIGACGDWCEGARVEGAFLSGLAMARRLIDRDNGLP